MVLRYDLTVTDAAGNNNTCTTSVTVKAGVVLQSAAQQILLFLVLRFQIQVLQVPTYTSTCGGAAVTYNDVVLSGNGTDCGVIKEPGPYQWSGY
ncbi:MAG: hypothetical protein R2784_10525 [Saprospiraceae bacterium]